MPKKAIERDIEIGKRVAQRREELGYSMDRVAELLGVNKSTVQRYETLGVDASKTMTMIGLADALCTTVEWLKGESEDKSKEEFLETERHVYDEVSGMLDRLYSQEDDADIRKAAVNIFDESLEIISIFNTYFSNACHKSKETALQFAGTDIDAALVAQTVYRAEIKDGIDTMHAMVDALYKLFDKESVAKRNEKTRKLKNSPSQYLTDVTMESINTLKRKMTSVEEDETN